LGLHGHDDLISVDVATRDNDVDSLSVGGVTRDNDVD
jgi:hypothetical protein